MEPFPRSKRDLVSFAEKTICQYSEDTYPSVCEAFQEDLLYWNKHHLSHIPNKFCHNLRGVLQNDNVQVRKNPGLRVSQALSEVLQVARDKSTEVHLVEKCTNVRKMLEDPK